MMITHKILAGIPTLLLCAACSGQPPSVAGDAAPGGASQVGGGSALGGQTGVGGAGPGSPRSRLLGTGGWHLPEGLHAL